MTTGEIHRHGPVAYPNWVPDDVRHYLEHTEDGCSIRALAREVGVHASTILRQVRRNETRRDDPLLDTALDRLAKAGRSVQNHSFKDQSDMTAQIRISKEALPDDNKVEAEARRILRRLAEPDACMAIAPGMEKAVVVREMPDGRAVRTAVLDCVVAEAFLVKEWITGKTKGKVARYVISAIGRSALKRLLAEHDAGKQGFAEASARFGDQHRDWEEREIRQSDMRQGEGRQGEGRTSKRIRYNVMESPLAALARRKDKDGKPFLEDTLVAAGERLREDFELAQMGPRVAQNWDRFMTAGDRGSYGSSGGGTGPEDARSRVALALRDLGPGLGDMVLRCCCFLEGMEQAEKRMGWSARSGKIVLKIALQRLSRHYGETGRNNMIG